MPYKSKRKQSAAAKKHYLNNLQIMKKRAAAFKKMARIRNRNFVQNFLKNNPCTDCPESDPIVLEFDHVRGVKHRNVADMINAGFSLKSIQKEIDKCEVRCANCHRRKTFKERKRGSRI